MGSLTPEELADRVRTLVERQLDQLETSPGIAPEDVLDCLAKIALVLQRIRIPQAYVPNGKPDHTDAQLMKAAGDLNENDF